MASKAKVTRKFLGPATSGITGYAWHSTHGWCEVRDGREALTFDATVGSDGPAKAEAVAHFLLAWAKSVRAEGGAK